MKNLINYLCGLSLLVVMMTVVSCKDDEDSLPKGWTQAQLDEGIADCQDGTTNTKEECTCFANVLANKYTYDQIVDFGNGDVDAETLIIIAGTFLEAEDTCGVEFPDEEEEETAE